ncbi:murein L,D-transpeptidase catalytic domain family protein [Lysobacter koreensis]|uniref:Murein L,D-transpeptidase catalytic domain family protein n=1 Tax=Lysobacter koreensis TaxID=266122 RepID=A0ABW2YNY9_9GAMM
MIRNFFTAFVLAAAFTACSSTDSRPDVQVTPGPHAPVASTAAPAAPADAVLEQVRRLAPDADPGVLALALEARACALRNGAARGTRLAVIDYSRPSTDKRLWVFDLERKALLHTEHVAHGRGSGENFARSFSNRDGSHQTSLGLFTTAETYDGGNGYSLRMDGLEPGVNDAARDRLIVMHGAPYVDPAQALRQGRLGRSYGCPALRPQVARAVIDTLKHDQLLFAYYPDDAWLAGSRWFGCSGRSARDILAAARGDAAGAASSQAVAAR